jgi:hypothetical protein
VALLIYLLFIFIFMTLDVVEKIPGVEPFPIEKKTD